MSAICTGSRHWRDKELIQQHLSAFPAGTTIIHGGQKSWDAERKEYYGADCLVDQVARELGFTVKVYPADWTKHGKAAGPIRNVQMYDENPDVETVLGFLSVDPATQRPYPNRGTNNCLGIAMRRGIPVVKVYDQWWVD